jgi:uncharacterized protein (DUF362 family)
LRRLRAPAEETLVEDLGAGGVGAQAFLPAEQARLAAGRRLSQGFLALPQGEDPTLRVGDDGEAGAADVVVLDRPTAPDRAAFERTGILEATENAGGSVKFLTDRNYENVAIPEGRVLTSWPLVTDVFEADTLINVPVAKVHGMAGLTLSMKNLMGIMGGQRGTVHQQFHQKIVDLCTLVKPHLVVLDATRMLVANGPAGGNLDDVRQRDTVVAGTGQVEVDAYGTTLFGRTPTDLQSLVNARDQGLGTLDLDALDILQGEV